jgi:hypothetical protein
MGQAVVLINARRYGPIQKRVSSGPKIIIMMAAGFWAWKSFTRLRTPHALTLECNFQDHPLRLAVTILLAMGSAIGGAKAARLTNPAQFLLGY